MLRKKAFSLVELFISMAVFMLIAVGVFTFYNNFRKSVDLGNLQEDLISNVQRIFLNIKKDIKMSYRPDEITEPVSLKDGKLKIIVFKDGKIKKVNWYLDGNNLIREEDGSKRKFGNGWVKEFKIEKYFLEDLKFYRIYLKLKTKKMEKAAHRSFDLEVVTSVFSRSERDILQEPNWIRIK